jgi:hypothetical protein
LLKDLNNISLADDYASQRQLGIDILIGQDHHWSFFKGGVIHLGEGLVAQETCVGWVISGSWSNGDDSANEVSHQFFCLSGISDKSLQNFWELESLGITVDAEVVDPVVKHFVENVKFIDGRYEVSLSWKTHFGSDNLMNNEHFAKKRLQNLSRKLCKDSDLRLCYDKVFANMETNDIIEEVPPDMIEVPNPVFYLPHRPVIREAFLST